GNVTIPAVSLVEDAGGNSNTCSMGIDSYGNAFIFVLEGHEYEPNAFYLYKVDGDTGDVLIDSKLIYSAPVYNISIIDPIILPTASGTEFYLLWLEEDAVRGWERYVKFAVIDASGDFIEEPYAAYDYTDEDPEDLTKLAACTNQAGDVFIHYTQYMEQEPYNVYGWITLGWFDHDSLGVEEDQLTRTADPSFSISASLSPFRESVIFTTNADPPPEQIAVYDISGRMVRSLVADPADGSFFWDGTDGSGEELPSGTYIVRGASEGRLASISVVKL
ncbi:MAG: FlgD immunoglobulin-like domain containing protein, partial [Candidatus Fermentibacterota bacterium]